MALPVLTPKSQMSKSILPVTGTVGNVLAALPFGMYADPSNDLFDKNFISGAVDQVAYTYKKLGGDVLDIELKAGNVYANYEEALLEYSYIVNIHQSKNVLSDVLGQTTGTFDQDGQLKTSLSGTHVNLKYPRFTFQYPRRVGDGYSHEANMGGTVPINSASFTLVEEKQDYDLQQIISTSTAYSGSVGDKRIIVRKVFYKTPQAMWRFFGYYGGLNVVGNLLYYGQYTDDSSFELIPVWQNKLQAMAYEDHLWTRLSHYSYELKDTMLRIFPIPQLIDTYNQMWVEFSVEPDAWDNDNKYDMGIDGINNMNTLPFDNIPYQNINSIGKQWIRRFSLALSKETLGQIRGKFGSIPIPGNDTTLNASDLLGQAATEQEALRTELKEVLDQLTYAELMKTEAEMVTAVETILKDIPLLIFQG
tara:strand:+ start:663 stop:1922 length:1260 start_codon:yes stop_codon:yes gene_type:complete